MACSGVYRIHNYSTSLRRGLTTALSTLRGVPSSNLRRLSPSGRRVYKALSCCKSPFVRGARPFERPVERVIQVRVHVARATESHNVARMPRGAGTNPCDAHLQQADDTPRCHGVDLSFLLSDFGSNFVRNGCFQNIADPNIQFAAIEFSICI